jgi:hypothetical protein
MASTDFLLSHPQRTDARSSDWPKVVSGADRACYPSFQPPALQLSSLQCAYFTPSTISQLKSGFRFSRSLNCAGYLSTSQNILPSHHITNPSTRGRAKTLRTTSQWVTRRSRRAIRVSLSVVLQSRNIGGCMRRVRDRKTHCCRCRRIPRVPRPHFIPSKAFSFHHDRPSSSDRIHRPLIARLTRLNHQCPGNG